MVRDFHADQLLQLRCICLEGGDYAIVTGAGEATLRDFMQKTFSLSAPGKDDARVRDKIRHELNKYVKRERRKALPEGYFRWELKCRLGPTEAEAVAVSWAEMGAGVDRWAEAGATQVFVEIEAVAQKRGPKPTAE